MHIQNLILYYFFYRVVRIAFEIKKEKGLWMKHIFSTYKLQMIKEKSALYEVNKQIGTPQDIEKILREVVELDLQSEEVLYLLCLNIKNNIIGLTELSRGTVSTCTASPRELAKRLINTNSARFIIAHNHPSNHCEPSDADKETCKKFANISKLLEIDFLDFVIISNDNFLSFTQRKIMEG